MLVASERSRPMMTRDTTQGVDIDVAQLHLRSFDAGLLWHPQGSNPRSPQTCLIRVNEHECGGTHLASTMDRTTQGVVMCTHLRLRMSAVSGGGETDRTPVTGAGGACKGKLIDYGPRFNANLVQVARLLAISRVVSRSLACAPCGPSSCSTKLDHEKFRPPAPPARSNGGSAHVPDAAERCCTRSSVPADRGPPDRLHPLRSPVHRNTQGDITSYKYNFDEDTAIFGFIRLGQAAQSHDESARHFGPALRCPGEGHHHSARSPLSLEAICKTYTGRRCTPDFQGSDAFTGKSEKSVCGSGDLSAGKTCVCESQMLRLRWRETYCCRCCVYSRVSERERKSLLSVLVKEKKKETRDKTRACVSEL